MPMEKGYYSMAQRGWPLDGQPVHYYSLVSSHAEYNVIPETGGGAVAGGLSA